MTRFALSAALVAWLVLGSVARAETPAQWQSFITPQQLQERQDDPRLLVIDARSAEEYAQGHIPGAVSIPGADWRTPSVKQGQGQSQYIFRTENDQPDVKRYEQFLSENGVRNDHHVVVYGAHAGKADGSVPAMILHWLGHDNVVFLDGVGLDEWTQAGYEVSTTPRTLEPSQYSADPIDGFVWSADDVKAALGQDDVVLYDTRSTKEFTGEDTKGNARGGHIPGAVLCNYEDFLSADKTVIAPADVQEKLQGRGITPDKTIVLYCQTATRVSLPLLALRDLGYQHVVIYDASMFEWANRDDTPIDTQHEQLATEPQPTNAQ